MRILRCGRLRFSCACHISVSARRCTRVGTMSDNEDNNQGAAREQDRFLPIANIARIMKKTLPGNAKIAKDAKEVSM